MKKAIEVWKDIPDYENHYLISNLGRVKSLKRNKEKILNLVIKKDGYAVVSMHLNQTLKIQRVHLLVAMAFLNHKGDGTNKIVVDHINNIKSDNRLCNLQLITNRENCSKDVKNKTSKYTGVHLCSNTGKWRASIKINGIQKQLGRFDNQEEAYESYKKALSQHQNAFKEDRVE